MRRAHAASNLGTALLERAIRMDDLDLAEYSWHFSESEAAFTEALRLDPANEHSAAKRAKLALVTKCRKLVSAYKLFNPHITPLGADAGCERIILRRLQKGQLSAMIFTCDRRAGAGLLWMYEAEALDPAAWAESLRDGLPTRRAIAYDARVMPAARWAGVREGELAMDEAQGEIEGGGEGEGRTVALFRVDLESLCRRGGWSWSHRRGAAAGAEKNWGPLVGPDGRLYMVYSARPHAVLRRDWAAAAAGGGGGLGGGAERLRCETVQRAENAYHPAAGPDVVLRGNSAAVPLPRRGAAGGQPRTSPGRRSGALRWRTGAEVGLRCNDAPRCDGACVGAIGQYGSVREEGGGSGGPAAPCGSRKAFGRDPTARQRSPGRDRGAVAPAGFRAPAGRVRWSGWCPPSARGRARAPRRGTGTERAPSRAPACSQPARAPAAGGGSGTGTVRHTA